MTDNSSLALCGLRRWRVCANALITTDLLFKSLAFILLMPALSLLVSGFLAVTGEGLLTDLDIARVLLHPLGLLGVVTIGAALLGIAALEQSALLTVAISRSCGRQVPVLEGLWFVSSRAAGVLQTAGWMVVRLLWLTAPFVALAGGLYLLLLTDHDINYYLSERPPRFWGVALVMGGVLGAGAAVVIEQIAGWSLALPLHLFEDVTPRAALHVSRERMRGRRWTISLWITGWLAVSLVLSALATWLVSELGERLVAATTGRLWTLVVVLGLVLAIWTGLQLALSLWAVITFALLLTEAYERWGQSEAFHLPTPAEQHPAWSLRWTVGRVVAATVLATLGAALLGALALATLPLEDHVEVAAHRGGAGAAPENSLSAIRQAIAHGTDWVEIDVQESSDGVVLVVHDADLQKLARFAGKIWETSAADLRAVDIGSSRSSRFASERVPTLAEVLDACRGRVGVVIELKYYGHDQQLEQRVVDLVESHGMADEIVIMSMNPRAIAKVRTLRPDWRIGLTTAAAAGDLTGIDADFLAVNARLATEPFVQLAHARDKQVFVWTINDPRTMNSVISRGVDVLITDYPDVARRVLAERAALTPGERLLLELSVWFDRTPQAITPGH